VVSILVDLQKKGEEYLKGAGGLIDGDGTKKKKKFLSCNFADIIGRALLYSGERSVGEGR
jgi:hypothetical protein